MIDVFNSLTSNYSIDQSRIALRDFYELMMNYTTNPYNAPYLGHSLINLFGEKNYLDTFNDFFSKLHTGIFYGSDYHSEDKCRFSAYLIRKYGKFVNKYYRAVNKKILGKPRSLPFNGWPKENMYIANYFRDQNELYSLMGEFVNKLFMLLTSKNKKAHWCEDTPANILHIDFLNNLFNQAYFIHIVRDPIGVAYSMRNQIWAPDNYQQIVYFLTNIYEKLIDIKEFAMSNSVKFIEIKLEDLHKKETINNLLSFLDLEDNFDQSVELQNDKVSYYRDIIPKTDFEMLHQSLSKYRKFYQYR
jgi:hypothetical protein